MLNPLADAAQQGETVIMLYVHPPAPFLDVAGAVAAVQNALVQDNAILPIGQAQGFQASDGTVFVGAAFVVPNQSGSDEEGTVLYDDILSPISVIPVVPTDYAGGLAGAAESALTLGALSSGPTGAILAFVDYGNNLNDAIQVAQTATAACSAANAAGNTGTLGGTPFYVTAIDSVGALTPYAQQAWAQTIAVGNANNTATGKVADTAQKLTQPIANFAAVIVGGLVTVLIGLWIADKAIGKAI